MTMPHYDTFFRVYYEDTDAAGCVYYARYLYFLERARTELLRAHTIDQRTLQKEAGIIFVVRSIRLDYVAPARLDDMLRIETCIHNLRGARIILTQNIYNETNMLLIDASVVLAALDGASFRPVRLPHTIRNAFLSTGAQGT